MKQTLLGFYIFYRSHMNHDVRRDFVQLGLQKNLRLLSDSRSFFLAQYVINLKRNKSSTNVLYSSTGTRIDLKSAQARSI
jgi:hypothetical protein